MKFLLEFVFALFTLRLNFVLFFFESAGSTLNLKKRQDHHFLISNKKLQNRKVIYVSCFDTQINSLFKLKGKKPETKVENREKWISAHFHFQPNRIQNSIVKIDCIRKVYSWTPCILVSTSSIWCRCSG